MHNKTSFIEYNPNPIIEVSRKSKSILYFNFSARIQFPTLEQDGLNSLVLQGIDDCFSPTPSSSSRLTLMVREVTVHKIIYEQQVFSVADEDSIFIYMSNIGHYKEMEKNAAKYVSEFKNTEQDYQSRLMNVQEELKHSLEIFNKRLCQERVALKAASVATWNWHVPCDLLTWDESMGDLLNVEPNVTSGNFNTLLNVIHPGDRNRVASDIRNSWHNKTTCETQFRISKPGGLRYQIRLKGSAYCDSYGQPVGLAGVCLLNASVTEVKSCAS